MMNRALTMGWALLVGLILSACSQKPKPPGPVVIPKSEIADDAMGRGLSLTDMGFTKEVELTSLEFYPVYFGLNRTDLTDESMETLFNISQDAPRFSSCAITGHACPLGTDEYNYSLGYSRAEEVAGFLKQLKVTASMSLQTRGESKLVSTNPDEYHLSRRVVVECFR